MGNSRKNSKEQFYTIPQVAETCIMNFIADGNFLNEFNRFLDPCAGSGSFSNILKNLGCEVDCYDIQPESDGVIEQDFLLLEPDKKYDAVITNPPFGRASSLGIKFFNHCTKFTDVIAFIVPKSWETKFFIHDKLDPYFYLIKTYDLPEVSFQTLDGQPYTQGNLNCVFQIWERCKYKRTRMMTYRSEEFDFIKPLNTKEILKENAYARDIEPVFRDEDIKQGLFAVRTHGNSAGEVLNGLHYNPRTVAWIKPHHTKVQQMFHSVDYSMFKDCNAYIPSLSPAEIAWCYDNKKNS